MNKLSDEDAYKLRWSLLYELALYEEVELTYDAFPNLSHSGERHDAYCVECAQFSTMKAMSTESRRTPYVGGVEMHRWMNVEVQCGRVDGHKQRFYFLNTRGWVMKIGQYPSLRDIAAGNLGRIRRVMNDTDKKELSTAIGLHAHGVGVGAFVYLRRIVERMVIAAELAAGRTPERGEGVMDRIKALPDKLPDFLVENAYLHGILSKGVHELGEDECKAGFAVVRAAIEQVFDDRLADLQRQEAKDRTKKALNNYNSQLAKGESPAPAPRSNG